MSMGPESLECDECGYPEMRVIERDDDDTPLGYECPACGAQTWQDDDDWTEQDRDEAAWRMAGAEP